MEIERIAKAADGEPAVETAGLSLERGGRLLFKRMSWQVPAGRFLAVTGPSGSGKTSLLACLRGNLAAAEGSISFASPDPRQVGTVFQHLRLTNELTVLTNVLCGCLGRYTWWRTLAGFASAERERAFALITDLGLEDLVHKPIRNVSGGEQQRTAIARVLLQDPAVILADEPTSNLDLALAEKVLSRFRELCTASGKTVISVLHDQDLVERFADMELRISSDFENGWSLRTINH